MKKLLFVAMSLVSIGCASTQITSNSSSTSTDGKTLSDMRPRLVVGITIDQMKHEYIYRYWDKYGLDGFKRLIDGGFFFENAHYNYTPTDTAPGHTSIYTGTTPSIHGVIGNSWYDKYSKQNVYCAGDTTYHTVGADSKAGQMSPHRVKTTTISDEIRLSTYMKGKAIGISIKDRGAILPAGHTGNGAYWFDSSTGKWVTSSYYTEKLPQWAQDFNSSGYVDRILESTWEPLLPISQYTESLQDNTPFEWAFRGRDTPTFPYDLSDLKERNGYGLINSTPMGNTMTLDLAREAIKGEYLGQDEHVDMLAVSLSSSDYVGHGFGTRAIETQDIYLRLDREIAAFLDFLDDTVGRGEYIIFLTADHGAAEVPLYMQNVKVPAGYFAKTQYVNGLSDLLNERYGNGSWIENLSNDQIFLNNDLISAKNVDRDKVVATVIDYSLVYEGIANAIDTRHLMTGYHSDHLLSRIQRGYHQKYSGDISLILEPGWLTYGRKGTDHGSSYRYDTHIPIIFYGDGVAHGRSYREVSITDIAPTISALLHVNQPNGCTGHVLHEAIKE